MKIAAIYTATTPELIETLNKALLASLDGFEAEILSYQNPAILQEARDSGGLTSHCAAMLMDLYEQARRDGADVILNVCSSVGEPARLAKPLYELLGIPFVRIDEDMALEALRLGARVGVLATLPTTLEPSKKLLEECAERLGVAVTLVDALADGAFGMTPDQFREKLIATARPIVKDIDVLIMAQGSMAYAEQDVAAALGVPVLSSVRFGAEAVRREVEKLAKNKQ